MNHEPPQSRDANARRIAAREQARVAASLIVEEAGRIAPDAQAAFWDELEKMIPETGDKLAGVKVDEPFTDHQSRAFGRTRIPFGKYAGTPVDQIAMSYLEKLCEPQPIIRSLKRYLASERIRAENREG